MQCFPIPNNGESTMYKRKKNTYEHRWVMEQIVGRPLRTEEHVHHRNEVKNDNDPNNLQLCPTPRDHAKEHAYDEDTLIHRLIRYNDVFGVWPRMKDCKYHSQMPSASTYVRMFGSWRKAIAKAQLYIEEVRV